VKGKELGWLGIRTSYFEETVSLFRDVMNLEIIRQEQHPADASASRPLRLLRRAQRCNARFLHGGPATSAEPVMWTQLLAANAAIPVRHRRLPRQAHSTYILHVSNTRRVVPCSCMQTSENAFILRPSTLLGPDLNGQDRRRGLSVSRGSIGCNLLTQPRGVHMAWDRGTAQKSGRVLGERSANVIKTRHKRPRGGSLGVSDARSPDPLDLMNFRERPFPRRVG
jgi:hypothetical protein